MDQLSNPAFATSIGLLLWGAEHVGAEPLTAYSNGSTVGAGFGRLLDWVRGLFPG
jgi:hypothetical protein